jgi:hypothetical protein
MTRLLRVAALLLLFLAHAAVHAPAQATARSGAAGPRVRAGLSTGLFFAPNPGDAFSMPSSVSGVVRVDDLLISPLVVTARVTVIPYLAAAKGFADSVMVMPELAVGLSGMVRPTPDLGLNAMFLLGGGGYRRASPVGRDVVARRPLAKASVSLGAASGRWRYVLQLHYRALFDQAVVHTFEPTFVVLYTVFAQEGEDE